MAIVLALVAAASWGTSDFFGGLAGRRATGDITVAISFASQVLGLIGLTIAALLLGGDPLTDADLWLALAAGAGGAAGVTFLYRGLTIGTMGVVAPITGAGAAALPVVVGAARGELPTLAGWVGIAVALVAIVLVSREPAPDPHLAHLTTREGRLAPGVPEAIAAGIGFGVIFVLLDATSAGSGLLPLIPMKISAVALLLLVALTTRRTLRIPRVSLAPVLTVGVLDNVANVAYLMATRRGLLALVAVVSSLYPVGTVLLARVVLQERLVRHQLTGLGLAALAVVLLAAG